MRFPLLLSALLLATPAFSSDIMVQDAYARSASPSAKTGAAFLTLMNHSTRADRLLSASSPAAARVELHTHIDAGDGVMQMRRVEAGFPLAAHGTLTLSRGGDHVMMMGLTRPFVQGEDITLTLTFEQAGAMTVTVPIDLERSAPGSSHGQSHGQNHGHSNGHNTGQGHD